MADAGAAEETGLKGESSPNAPVSSRAAAPPAPATAGSRSAPEGAQSSQPQAAGAQASPSSSNPPASATGAKAASPSAAASSPSPQPHSSPLVALESRWTLWFDRILSCLEYEERLRRIGTFDTVQGFWVHYVHLARPSLLLPGDNYQLFRDDTIPAWESVPNAGCWVLRVPCGTPEVDLWWEKLLLAAIGEKLGGPVVVGVSLCARDEESAIALWLSEVGDVSCVHRAGQRLCSVLGLPAEASLEWRTAG